jgi:ABC-type oligopeptide transport system ATPase subunit
MVLESQISEAAQSYEMLLQEVGLKDEKLDRYSHKLRDMNVNEDKERMIQKQVKSVLSFFLCFLE